MPRPPAPGRLALVQAFLNTNDIEAGTDRLDGPETAVEWLADAGLGGAAGAVDAGGAERLRHAREVIRELVAANGGRPLTDPAADELARLAGESHLRLALAEGRVRLVAAADEPVAAVLLAIADATTEGDFGRLRICENDRCRWAFYDHSRNGRSRWCTAAGCGNKAYTRAYRERRAAARLDGP